jgi:hypothetical protein
MKFSLPIGNPEVVSDVDVEALMRTELVPHLGLILGFSFMDSGDDARIYNEWNFEDGRVELIAKCDVRKIEGDEFYFPSVEVDRVIQLHIGVRVSHEEHDYYKLMELLQDDVDESYARMLRSGRLCLYRFFTLYYDPSNESIRGVSRRAGFLDSKDKSIYDIDCPEDDDRDDEQVCYDEFELLKTAISRIR